MRYRRRSIMFGAGLFTAASILLPGAYASTALDSSTAVATVSYPEAVKAALSQPTPSPYWEGRRAGARDGHAAGKRVAYTECANVYNPSPLSTGDAYGKGYAESWDTAFPRGFAEGHKLYCQ